MGTRALIEITDETDTVLVTLYKHMDGYPAGLGKELATFLKPIKIVNGLSYQKHSKIANGVGCLAAQLIAEFKQDAGGLYVYPPGTRNVGEEFIYLIHPVGEDVVLTIKHNDDILMEDKPQNFETCFEDVEEAPIKNLEIKE